MISMLKVVFEIFLLIHLLIVKHWQYQMVMKLIPIEILFLLIVSIHLNYLLKILYFKILEENKKKKFF
jgi:hypothetical protein